ncbi:MAG: PsbP-related protein [Bacteroidota bacterium]
MKKISNLLILFTYLIFFTHPVSAQKLTTLNKKDYSIGAPADWIPDSSKQMGTDLVIFSMLENGTDKFRENVNVVIQNLAGMNIDLEKYTAISIGQIKTMATDSKIEESKTIRTDRATFQKIIYTATQGGFKLRFEQYYFMANKKAYTVSFTAEIGKFDIFKPTGEAILNSFVLK